MRLYPIQLPQRVLIKSEQFMNCPYRIEYLSSKADLVSDIFWGRSRRNASQRFVMSQARSQTFHSPLCPALRNPFLSSIAFLPTEFALAVALRPIACVLCCNCWQLDRVGNKPDPSKGDLTCECRNCKEKFIAWMREFLPTTLISNPENEPQSKT